MTRQPADLTSATKGGAQLRRKRLPAPTGRTSALNDEVSKRVCDAVRAGAYLSTAARYAGIAPQTLSNWLRMGAEAYGPKDKRWIYRIFSEAVEEAEAQSEVAANLQWRAAWAKDWHAAEKWLSVRYPERYRADRDPNAPTGSAFAGVNVTINTPGGQTTSSVRAEAANVPLESLIEANPRLLSATMHLFDEIDALYGDSQPEEPSESREIVPYAVDTSEIQPDDVIEGLYTRIGGDDEA